MATTTDLDLFSEVCLISIAEKGGDDYSFGAMTSEININILTISPIAMHYVYNL